MDQNSDLILVLVTAPDQDSAELLAKTLVEKKLAACVNLYPGLKSIYRWDGDVHEDKEMLLMIKTQATLFEDQLIPLVQELHPYDTPEIIALPIVAGEKNYLDWIQSETEIK